MRERERKKKKREKKGRKEKDITMTASFIIKPTTNIRIWEAQNEHPQNYHV